MPGIVGIISPKSSDNNALFSKMLESLNHFDYKIDFTTKDNIYFGNVSLGYLNNNGFKLSDNKRFLIAFCGEIFSYKTIETSQIGNDSEFFLKQFITDGLECLKWFNGQYCAALFDSEEEKLYLFSDRMGTRPLYYAQVNDSFYFAPEVKAILKSQVSRAVDDDAIADLFNFGHLFGHKTLFKEIKQLPEASYLVLSKGSYSIHKYWEIPEYPEAYSHSTPNRKEVENFTDELIDIFSNAMRRNFAKNSDKILISLSGGLDSRYVAAFAKRLNVDPLVSFTMGPNNSEDQIYSKLVAENIGMQHNPFEIKPKDIWKDAKRFAYFSDYMSMIYGPIQGFGALEHFFRKTHITVSSQMCDALFGSTLARRKIQLLANKNGFDDEAKSIITNMFKLFDDKSIKLVFTNDFYLKIKDKYQEIPQQYINSTNIPVHAYFNLLINEHVRRGTLSGNLMNNLFMETRMPSFDNDVIDFSYRLPLKMKEWQYLYRRAFTKLYPELAKINRQHYNVSIDASNLRYKLSAMEIKASTIIKSSKLGTVIKHIPKYNRPNYVNYDLWFKHDLYNEMVSIVLDERTLSRGIFNREGLKQLIELHKSTSNNYAKILWQVINLEYFFRNNID